MSFKQAATDLVLEALDRQIEVLILRGVDEFAQEGGDIDVLVPRNQARLAMVRTAERAVEAGWKIVGIRDIGYLAQICLTKRGDADGQYRAVKIDFFNGTSWCALGKDRLTRALFDIRDSGGEQEAVGLATLVQKLLYAGYLRECDRARIFAACDLDRIEAFVAASGLPLSRATLERGALSKITRWSLRAASGGVHLSSVPVWVAQVVWRRIRFGVIRSTFPATVIVAEGAGQDRWRAVSTRFRSLLEHAGFPRPTIVRLGGANGLATARRLLDAWHVLRGDTVLTGPVHGANVNPRTLRGGTSVYVRLMDRASDGSDDLDTFLTKISKNALSTLRRIENQ